jgi:hypothetical protein
MSNQRNKRIFQGHYEEKPEVTEDKLVQRR